MSGPARRGGIPGPESRTGLIRPAMTEAEFERRQHHSGPAPAPAQNPTPATAPAPAPPMEAAEPVASGSAETEPSGRGGAGGSTSRSSRATRSKPAKPRRVQRMFALEEELDKKLWLYAIHVGKDRSEVINDLLRPIVASMVLYDSRDRRASSNNPRPIDSEGEAA